MGVGKFSADQHNVLLWFDEKLGLEICCCGLMLREAGDLLLWFDVKWGWRYAVMI